MDTSYCGILRIVTSCCISRFAVGRVCALPTVSCPPAIPIVVSGEVIGPAALELFAAYGVETVSVVKPEKF